MADDSSSAKLPLLSGPADWLDWADRLETRLGREKVLYLVRGTVREGKSEQDMEDDRLKVMDIIKSALPKGGEAAGIVRGSGGPKDAWDKLSKRYGRMEPSSLVTMGIALNNMVQNNLSVEEWIAKVNLHCQTMQAYGQPVKAFQQASVLIRGLNSRFTTWQPSIFLKLNDAVAKTAADIAAHHAAAAQAAQQAATTGANQAAAGGESAASATLGASQRAVDISNQLRADEAFIEMQIVDAVVDAIRGAASTLPELNPGKALVGAEPEAKSPKKGKGRSRAKDRCSKCKELGHWRRDCPNKEVNKGAGSDGQQGKGKGGYVMVTALRASKINTSWVCDSGAYTHMSYDEADFQSLDKDFHEEVMVGGGHLLQARGKGVIKMEVRAGKENSPLTLTEALWVPDLGFKLFSLDKVINTGSFAIDMSAAGLIIRDKSSKVVATGTRDPEERSIFLDVVTLKPTLITGKPVSASHGDWHLRLGHVAEKAVKATLEYYSITAGTAGGVSKDGTLCEPCLKGGRIQSTFGHHQKATRMLERVHLDLMGPVEVATASGKQYILTIVEETSGLISAKPLRLKSDAKEEITQWIVWAERHAGCKLRALQSDRGGEFVNTYLSSYLKERGIEHRLSIPGTPQQNGIAERANRTLLEMTRAMLLAAHCPPSLWGEAVVYASQVLNVIKREGRKPAVAKWNLKVHLPDYHAFGCTAWARVASPQGKLGARSAELFFAGFTPGVKGWRLLDRSLRVTESRDVIFDDDKPFYKTPPAGDGTAAHLIEQIQLASFANSSPHDVALAPAIGDETTIRQPVNLVPTTADGGTIRQPVNLVPTTGDETTVRELVNLVPTSGEEVGEVGEAGMPTALPENGDDYDTTSTLTSLSSDGGSEDEEEEEEGVKRTRSGRQVKPPERFRGYGHAAIVALAAAAAQPADEPKTVEQARERHDWPLWKAAIEKEIENHRRNQTWRMEPLPQGRKLVSAKWVFVIKRKANGEIDKYKARLVARGFSQSEGIDYQETFSPVVRTGVIRLVIAIAAMRGWQVHQMDVTAAYLNGKLEEAIFMQQPPGYPIAEQNLVCRLQKGLYGLKQSGRLWYQRADKELLELGFARAEGEAGLYIFKKGNGSAMLCLYVDDVIIAASEEELMTFIKGKLRSSFEMTDGGKLHFVLGIEVVDGKHSIVLTQRGYVEKVLRRFGLASANKVNTPLPHSFVSHKADQGAALDAEEAAKYKSIVGSIMYAAMGTRPDIAFATQRLSRRLDKATDLWLKAAIHLLRYLSGTKELGLIIFKGKQTEALEIFSDADYAGDTDTALSTTGVLAVFNGSCISWTSRLQKTVTLSTLEAEYVALHEGVKEALWLRRVLQELKTDCECVTIWVDNEGAIATVKDTRFHQRTKHINVKYHFVRQHHGVEVSVRYVPTAEQKADVLTKLLARGKHELAIKQLAMK